MNEDQILSEFIDGELPVDVAAMVEARLASDVAVRLRYEKLKSLRDRLHGETSLNQVRVADMQARVWHRLQRNLSPRPSRVPRWLATLTDVLSARISLPMPALAGLAVVFVALGFFAVLRPLAPASFQNLATTSGNGQAVMSIPSLGSRGIPVSEMGITPTALSASPAAQIGQNGTGMAVTIEVQNLRQLLGVLENNQGIREFTIQLPQQQVLEPLGEPALLSASELNTGKP